MMTRFRLKSDRQQLNLRFLLEESGVRPSEWSKGPSCSDERVPSLYLEVSCGKAPGMRSY
jgi:hypothetical protein